MEGYCWGGVIRCDTVRGVTPAAPPRSVLGIIHRYDAIKRLSAEQRKRVVPRVCIIGGKAAPGYEMAKRIIKLVREAVLGLVVFRAQAGD